MPLKKVFFLRPGSPNIWSRLKLYCQRTITAVKADSSKNSLAITDLFAEKAQLANYSGKPPSLKQPHSQFPTKMCTVKFPVSTVVGVFVGTRGAFHTEILDFRGHFCGNLRVHSRVHSREHFCEHFRERLRGSNLAVRVLWPFLIFPDSLRSHQAFQARVDRRTLSLTLQPLLLWGQKRETFEEARFCSKTLQNPQNHWKRKTQRTKKTRNFNLSQGKKATKS